ncbi:MAG: chemotaxis response regulator protein-glutamate methylesterase [Alphaproteobacteria bacterium]|nr:chemotaxis response regulator protein-glutamate methylesterase [Alphaproteobacteria bacterium]
MVVDDSAVIRGMFTKMLEAEGDIEVVATAGDGSMALKAIERKPAEVILLDIEMPNMDGLTALPKLIEAKPDVMVIMASSLTQRNAEITLRAMRMGAADCVAKPSSTVALRSADDFKRDLVSKVRALGRKNGTNGASKTTASPVRAAPPVNGTGSTVETISLRKPGVVAPEVLAIGSSTGGPQALAKCIRPITKAISLPILVTQHMPATFTAILAQHLAQASGWPSAEGEDGEPVKPGRIYVAPGDCHMLVENSAVGKVIRLSDSPPENFCRPAVDPMLRSIAEAYGAAVLVLILTGMGHDGQAGSEDIVNAGGTVIAQDEATSVVWGMPGAVAQGGLCSAVLPLDKISGQISQLAA